MNLSVIQTGLKSIGRTIDQNSPTILTSLGVGGLIATVAFAIRGTVKATDILQQEGHFRLEQYEKQTGEVAYPDDMFTTQEIIELTWKEYIPTAVMGVTTIACMIGANHISLRRNAALVSLFTMTERTLREYQTKVVEQIGEKKEEKVREAIAQDRIDENPPSEKTIVLTGNGDYLCFDTFSSRYFRSDVEKLRRAENQFNKRLIRGEWLGINEFYDEIGLEPIELGDEFGWIAERSIMELKFTTKMAKDSNEPCLVMDYYVTPHHI